MTAIFTLDERMAELGLGCATNREEAEMSATDDALVELVDALQDVFALMQEGYLVRSIHDDHEPGWAIRQLPFVCRLAAAAKVLEKHRPHAEEL